MALVELGRFSHPEAYLLVARLESAGLMALPSTRARIWWKAAWASFPSA